MKAQQELMRAITNVAMILNSKPETHKEELAKRLARVTAALQVFTDLNFTEDEQIKLFDMAGREITDLKGRVQ